MDQTQMKKTEDGVLGQTMISRNEVFGAKPIRCFDRRNCSLKKVGDQVKMVNIAKNSRAFSQRYDRYNKQGRVVNNSVKALKTLSASYKPYQHDQVQRGVMLPKKIIGSGGVI